MFHAKDSGLTRRNFCILPKGWAHGRKVMLLLWRDHRYVVHFKFLNPNKTINAYIYSQQLQQGHENLRKRSAFINRKNIPLLDNASSRSSRITRENIGFKSVCSTSSTIFLRSSIKYFFVFFQMLWITRVSQENQARMSEENFERSKKESSSQLMNSKRWFEIIANLQIIEMNTLFNYSWRNYKSLKQKAFTTQPSRLTTRRNKDAVKNETLIMKKYQSLGSLVNS